MKTMTIEGFNMTKENEVRPTKEKQTTLSTGQFFYRHPYIAYWIAFIAMPIAVLLAVMAAAAVVILPFSFLLGLI